jgi:glycosyltransferase involved in cell wall biosynthesis
VLLLDYKSLMAKSPRFIKFAMYVLDELNISIRLLKVLSKTDAVLIFQKNHVFPSSIVRLSGKRLILFVGGSSIMDSFFRVQDNPSLMNRIIYASNVLIRNVCNALPDAIVTISPSMIKSAGLERYKRKVRFAPIFPNLSNASLFDIKKQYCERKPVIGFVGSHEKVKGIMNFVEAMLLVLQQLDNVHVVIIGKGTLSDAVHLKLDDYCALGRVEILGWVAYEALPKYYNDFRLLILPSYSEGAPSVIFEAMSCGTPVLATTVGGIADIIKNGETGFLLESNDPENIANRVMNLLNNSKMTEEVSKKAYKWIKENVNEEKAIEAWQEIFK